MYCCKGGDCVLKHRCKNWIKIAILDAWKPLFYIKGNHFYCKMLRSIGTQPVRKK